MQISREDLTKRYATLSDLELLAIARNDLTDLARQCWESELLRRHLSDEVRSRSPARNVDGRASHEVPTDWLTTAATACSFQVGSGEPYAQAAELACEILREAGIPTQVVGEHEDGVPDLISVQVPGALALKATSVLDRDLFNKEQEVTWRAHFDELSDEELHALHPADLCAGLLDRADRLKRAYEEAWARRQPDSVDPE